MAKLGYVFLFGLTRYVLIRTLVSVEQTHEHSISKYFSIFHNARSGSQNREVRVNKFLSPVFHPDISDKNPRMKNKILHENLKQFLKTSLQSMNLRIDRMSDIFLLQFILKLLIKEKKITNV